MKAGHVIYKTKNLDKTVEEFINMGFIVEYGKIKKPNNALIYFSNGAYIEILEKTGMPKIVKLILKLVGKNKFIDRLNIWDYGDIGLNGLCLEGTKTELNEVKIALNKEGVSLSPKRNDTKGRILKYKVFFPNDIDYPFFMTHFSIEPRPKNIKHPNGVKEITKITYPMSRKKQQKICFLINDETIVFSDSLTEQLTIEFDNKDIKVN